MPKARSNSGRQAESAVAGHLKSLGYKILDQNWRTRVCEIDVIGAKSGVVYFVEVKYRKNDSQGSGVEYITASKLKQMKFAAEVWASQNNWLGDYQLIVAEVADEDFARISLINLEQ